MKLNAISRVLRTDRIKRNGKAAIFSSALLAILAAPVYSAEVKAETEAAKTDKTVSTIEVKNKLGEIKDSPLEK